MTTQLLQISDRVKVGGKLGTVIAVEPRPSATIYAIAFAEGPPQKFITPPTAIEKIYSPIELLRSGDFDPPVNFDLLFEANRLSLAYEYDHLLSLSSTRTNLEPYQEAAVYKVLNSYKQRFLIADWASATSLFQLPIACRFFDLRLLYDTTKAPPCPTPPSPLEVADFTPSNTSSR